MKKLLLLTIIVLLFLGCNRPGDCIESSGDPTSRQYEIAGFSKIVVFGGIGLVISEGPEYKIEVRTGSNIIDNIEVSLSDNLLTLKDNTSCNWVREYGETMVYITAPNLTDIYSKTEKDITSNGILNFPNLRLVSMDVYDGFSGSGTGDYIMQIDNDNFVIESNSMASFIITGHTNNYYVLVYEMNGIIETQGLIAENVSLYHRGSNDMNVHPVNSISGDIFNIGNVYCGSRPPIANVVQHYQGALIYN